MKQKIPKPSTPSKEPYTSSLATPTDITSRQPLTPQRVLNLQHTIGNQAVMRMLAAPPHAIQREWIETGTKGSGIVEWEGKWPPDMSTFPDLSTMGPATKKAFAKHKLPGAKDLLSIPKGTAAKAVTSADIKSIAETAVAFTKMSTPLGSFNKGYGATAPVPHDKQGEQATMPDRRRIVNATKSLLPVPKGMDSTGSVSLEDAIKTGKVPMEDMIKYGQVVIGGKAGNCFELSSAALIYISGQLKDTAIDYAVVSLSAPGDHAFVVINQPADASGQYPKNFSAWNANAYIVDPWIGVACKASDYPAKWHEVMDDWAAATLSIGASKPTNPMWYDAVTANDKLRWSSRT